MIIPSDRALTHAVHLLVFDRLLQFYTYEEATAWMFSPHPQLDGRTPVLELKTATGYGRVQEILDRLESDAYL